MENEMDKGIKKAVSSQMAPRLASNFTYRTLERIRQETARREACREKRQFTLMLICVFLMLGSSLGVIIIMNGIRMDDVIQGLHSVRRVLSEGSFSLPVIFCLPLLGLFNYWLQKKIKQLPK